MFIEQIVNVKDLFMCLFIVLGIYGLVAEIKIYYYLYIDRGPRVRQGHPVRAHRCPVRLHAPVIRGPAEG